MSEFEIEKGIAIPKKAMTNHIYKWPWPDMEVDDSIKIDGDDKELHKALTSAYQYGRRNEPIKKFQSRKLSSTEARIWRVS